MKLYFNGCSFTHGDELNNPSKDSWPSLVASNLNCNFLNDAVSGGTNDRIVYKTLLAPTDFDCFFIAWTDYSRFTEYNPVDNFEINFNSQFRLDTSLHHSDDLKKNYSKYKLYGEMYYKHWYNELYEFKKWLQQIILLQCFFKTHDKKYLMLNTMRNKLSKWLAPPDQFISSIKDLLDFFDQIDDQLLMAEYQQIQNLNSLIDKSNFIEWNEWCILDLTSTHPCGPNGHILDSGHLAVAQKVLNYYNKIS